MPRIYKGTETILKLYVHQCEVGDINTLRIALFTDTVDNSVEFYSDNMSVDGDTVFLRVNAWSFDMMNDGVINYIAHIESGEETFITERQSNYFLKTPTAYEPTITPNMDNYYTKGEVDELLENVEGGESDVTKEYVDKQDADLWKQLKLTEGRYIGVRSGDSSYGSAIKDGNMEFIFATINGESILGTKDILIQGGSGGGSTEVYDDCLVLQYVGDYTVDFDGTSVEYNYAGSERQQHNIQVIQKVLSGEAKSVYYQYLHEQVYRQDEDGYNNKPTWLMMPMVYRYPSHDGIARFMGVINKDEWGGKSKLYAVGIMMRESNASIYQYNESWINLNSGGGSVDLSNYYTKGEVDDIISNIEIPEGGDGSTSDPDSYILYYPENYTESTYEIDSGEYLGGEEFFYSGDGRMEHNAQVIQAINEGKVKSVYLQRIREYFSEYDWENGTRKEIPIWMYVPMQFRQKNEIVDGYTRIFGYYALSEDDNNQIYLVGYNFNDDGSADISIDRSYELEQSGGGGSSGGGDYDSNPTFDSITVNGGAYFNSEIVMAGGGQSGDSDIASGIACAFKAGKTQSIDQWVRNIHTGTDGQGLRVCSYDEYGETQYMAVDTEGNIYEGNTKLSDKYASIDVIGDINNILSSI